MKFDFAHTSQGRGRFFVILSRVLIFTGAIVHLAAWGFERRQAFVGMVSGLCLMVAGFVIGFSKSARKSSDDARVFAALRKSKGG